MVLIIYHHGCVDGMTAAALVSHFMRTPCEYHPGQYYQPPPSVKDKDVYMVDFCYPKDIMNKIYAEAKSLLVIDHHQTSAASLVDIPDHCKVWDTKHCGAMLVWRHFLPTHLPPQWLEWIEDYDLWKHHYSELKPFHLGWSGRIRQPDEVRDLDPDFFGTAFHKTRHWSKILEYGTLAQEYVQSQIERTIAKASYYPVDYGDKIIIVAYLNCTADWGNEAADTLLRKWPWVDVVVIYRYRRPEDCQLSLRSRKDGINVADIAKAQGGGGHPTASGCRQTTPLLKYFHWDPRPLVCRIQNTPYIGVVPEEYTKWLDAKFG